MIYIPEITPVQQPNEIIPPYLLEPGSVSEYFPTEIATRVVYMDEQFENPPRVHHIEAERERQRAIWGNLASLGAFGCFIDVQKCSQLNSNKLSKIRREVKADLGTLSTAAAYSQIYSRVLQEELRVMLISTGIQPFNGSLYHEVGYVPVG